MNNIKLRDYYKRFNEKYFNKNLPAQCNIYSDNKCFFSDIMSLSNIICSDENLFNFTKSMEGKVGCAWYSNQQAYIFLSEETRLFPKSCEHTLLHEMIHIYAQKEFKEIGHEQNFINKANEIARKLGLTIVDKENAHLFPIEFQPGVEALDLVNKILKNSITELRQLKLFCQNEKIKEEITKKYPFLLDLLKLI